jgi:hypothetical protein
VRSLPPVRGQARAHPGIKSRVSSSKTCAGPVGPPGSHKPVMPVALTTIIHAPQLESRAAIKPDEH